MKNVSALDHAGETPDAAAAPAPPLRSQPQSQPQSQLPSKSRPSHRARQIWMKQLHSWHWISAAISLVGMLLFAITGITLNHAATISATPKVTTREATLSPPLLTLLKAEPPAADSPLPQPVVERLDDLVGLDASGRAAEWSGAEVYVALPGPGRDAWISIDRATGAVASERTDRGAVSYLNDLHKGRNTGDAWFWFIDIFAVACVIFTITGLLLLQIHARRRPATWPVVIAGTAIPVALALFFIH